MNNLGALKVRDAEVASSKLVVTTLGRVSESMELRGFWYFNFLTEMIYILPNALVLYIK